VRGVSQQQFLQLTKSKTAVIHYIRATWRFQPKAQLEQEAKNIVVDRTCRGGRTKLRGREQRVTTPTAIARPQISLGLARITENTRTVWLAYSLSCKKLI
jgi:hypothetical protein